MADKSFGIRSLNLIQDSGTPSFTSPNNFNINAINVAFSTDISIGGKVSSNLIVGFGYSVGVGSLTPTSALDVNGTITASSFKGSGQSLTGIGLSNVSIVGATSITSLNELQNSDFAVYSVGNGLNKKVSFSIVAERLFSGGIYTATFGSLGVTTSLTATQYYGSGINLTGIVTSIIAGTNVSISTSNGAVTINATGGGGGLADSYWGSTSVGIGTIRSVGVGTTNPTSTLTVIGSASITGTTSLFGSIRFGTGSENIKIGYLAGGSGNANIAIGDQVLTTSSSGLGHNIGLGQFALNELTGGQYNVTLGDRAGQKITSGSYNVLIGAYDGQTGLDIKTSSNNVVLSDGAGNIRQYINSSGNVGIKTTIVTEALTVAGVVSATSFYGTLNAGQLTGALPAIDGSALTGVTAVGSGVEIRNNNTPLGVAATINFGSNINITLSSGIATVTGVTSVTNSSTAYALAGSPNLNVGVVTATNFKVINSSKTTNIGETYIEIGEGVGSNLGPTYIDFHGPGGSSDYSTRFIQYKQSDIDTGNVGGFEILVGNNHTNPFRIKNVSNGYKYFDTISNSVQLYNSDNKKFETTGYGISVYGGVNAPTGVVTASSFSGSGSGLTNLPAAQLTGTLPAIDGSQLLNVTASGTGIVVRSNNVTVGSAVTVNFGTGLGVTFSSGIATITSTGGSLQSRITVSGVTTSIPNLGIGNTDITGFKSYSLMRVGLSTAGWIRLYTDSTSRANDVNRSVGEDPAPGSGVIAEIVTTGISTQQMITPFVMGGNMDNPVTDKIYVAITNLSGTTQTITANLTILQLEA